MAKIVIDSFFHQMPGHRLSRNISVGGYTVNVGRYSPYDVYHPNGISMLLSDLIANFDISYSNEPFSEMSLCSADILIVPNPDYPMYEGAAAYRLDHHDVDAMMAFLQRGGSILMLVNSFLQKSDFWEENFDYERVSPYFRRLGVTWDPNYMSDADHILPAKSGKWTVGYGQGGRVDGALPEGAQEILSWNGEIYGFLKKVGKGTAAVIGDAGLVSNGLYGFPTFNNRAFINELMEKLTPDFGHATFEKLTYGSLSCATKENGVREELFRSLLPGAEFQVDHHYRHLVWETPKELVDAEEIALPFSLAQIAGSRQVEVTLPLIQTQAGSAVNTVAMTLNVSKTVLGDTEEYLVSGTKFSEGLTWEDVGADPAVFGEIGQLVRVNTVAQYLVGVEHGRMKWASAKQGQILYDRNLKNVHYGYDIILGSRCTVYAPTAG